MPAAAQNVGARSTRPTGWWTSLGATPADGAGRQMSRKQALNTIAKSTRDMYLKERGVTLLGGGLDESPQAYKPIEQVIAAQSELVEVVGKFSPRIVRMADEAGEF